MKRARLLLIPAALAAILFWALAQPAPQTMSSRFPAGAVLYLEAKDFSALLADWNNSAEKKDWLVSANYDAFSRSQLFLKLGDAQTQFASAAGIPPDYALLTSIAGSNAAFAMYDIGKLEFLYVAHLPSARAMNSSLWKTRAAYQTRHAGNADYFIKEDKASHRVAAFAYTGDYLLLATREDLIARALQLMAREAIPSVASETWFRDATAAAPSGANDLRLVYNMTALARTFAFRSHWVQQNVADLRQFSSGLADLERAPGEIRERRVLLRATPLDAEPDQAAMGQLLAAVPDDAGLYRAWLHPPAAQAAQQIEEKLFPQSTTAPPRSTSAPVVAEAPDAGSEMDLESRIDEAPLTETRDSFKALRDLFAATPIDAMLEVSSTQIDAGQVYVRPHSVIVLLRQTPWDSAAIRAALGTAAQGLWSNDSPSTWRANGELEGLSGIAMAAGGKWLVVGDSAALVNGLFARRNRTAVTGATYAAGWRHAHELPNFERMTRLIDFPQAGAEPLFFSNNIASLGRTLKRLDTATIVLHDVGTMLRESVVYKVNP